MAPFHYLEFITRRIPTENSQWVGAFLSTRKAGEEAFPLNFERGVESQWCDFFFAPVGLQIHKMLNLSSNVILYKLKKFCTLCFKDDDILRRSSQAAQMSEILTFCLYVLPDHWAGSQVKGEC